MDVVVEEEDEWTIDWDWRWSVCCCCCTRPLLPLSRRTNVVVEIRVLICCSESIYTVVMEGRRGGLDDLEI